MARKKYQPVSNVDKLIEQLDDTRDYGKPFAEVVNDIQLGLITIEPGFDAPILKDMQGHKIKGTGKRKTQLMPQFTSAINRLKELEGNRDWFENTMKSPYNTAAVKTGDKVLRDWLFDQAIISIAERQNGSAKLIWELFTQHIGKPKETSMGGLDALAKAMTEMLSGEGDIPVNTGEVIEGEFKVG